MHCEPCSDALSTSGLMHKENKRFETFEKAELVCYNFTCDFVTYTLFLGDKFLKTQIKLQSVLVAF